MKILALFEPLFRADLCKNLNKVMEKIPELGNHMSLILHEISDRVKEEYIAKYKVLEKYFLILNDMLKMVEGAQGKIVNRDLRILKELERFLMCEDFFEIIKQECEFRLENLLIKNGDKRKDEVVNELENELQRAKRALDELELKYNGMAQEYNTALVENKKLKEEIKMASDKNKELEIKNNELKGTTEELRELMLEKDRCMKETENSLILKTKEIEGKMTNIEKENLDNSTYSEADKKLIILGEILGKKNEEIGDYDRLIKDTLSQNDANIEEIKKCFEGKIEGLQGKFSEESALIKKADSDKAGLEAQLKTHLESINSKDRIIFELNKKIKSQEDKLIEEEKKNSERLRASNQLHAERLEASYRLHAERISDLTLELIRLVQTIDEKSRSLSKIENTLYNKTLQILCISTDYCKRPSIDRSLIESHNPSNLQINALRDVQYLMYVETNNLYLTLNSRSLKLSIYRKVPLQKVSESSEFNYIIQSFYVSNDEKFIIVKCKENILLYEILQDYKMHHVCTVQSHLIRAKFTSDGIFCVTYSETFALIWDFSTKKCLTSVPQDYFYLIDLAFSDN